ncbi:3676_t:CDS:2 [Funneliformis caledonium]|uniref:3676_t:CDS:1 n=1 Tax=Funneliformis caledonium TaxID=1117310 RepID=A0A9N9G1N6_9GLOM|nr:3676_t:CDS:2 [Funneliformis caledonium]
MTRPKKDRINKYHSKVANSSTRTRKLIKCKCTLRCHGSKFVDPRTFENHQQEMERFRLMSISKGKEKVNPAEQDYNSSCNSSNDDDDELISVYQEPIDVPKKRKRYAKFFDADGTVSDYDESETVLIPSDDEEGFEIPVNNEESSTEEDNRNLSEEDISVEQFTAPDFDEFEVESDDGYPDRNINFDDL